jgi:predicted nucleotidyltransferase component of viral defense system
LAIESTFETIIVPLKVDISTGDKITPKEINYSFKSLFEDKYIEILAYNIETILAEKFETILSRGILNTRARDFYDVYILLSLRKNDINQIYLKKAVTCTII